MRLFQNLITNAVKYRSEQAPKVYIAAERHGPDWVITVRDNGIGIPREHHRRIFNLFTRLHRRDSRPGIGLSVCKKVVEKLGGTIWVGSDFGAGSTFCFRIPAMEHVSGPESRAERL